MLNPEVAKKQLAEYEVKDWQARLKSRIALLPRYLLQISEVLLFPNAPELTYEECLKRSEQRNQTLLLLNDFSDEDRDLVLNAWFGELAPSVERGWQLYARLPYQVGHTRKAFRSAMSPSGGSMARANWLMALCPLLLRYEGQTLDWFAAWTPYIGYYSDALGILFAAAIDAADPVGNLFPTPSAQEIATGAKVFDVLMDSARGEHEIGAFGRHVCRALLVASRPEGWEMMEKMLLAAQRQEGLRQVILEIIDEAHPEAFRRMLRVILDNDLCRFSAVIRAVNVWFGFGYEAMNNRAANTTIAQTLLFLEDENARQEAIAQGEAHAAYLALWSLATQNADEAVPLAAEMLNDGHLERRFTAAHFLAETGLPAARVALLPALEDTDLRVAWRAFQGVTQARIGANEQQVLIPSLFEHLERFAARFQSQKDKSKGNTEDKTLPALVWPWLTLTVQTESIGHALMAALGSGSPKRLLPYLGLMQSYSRGAVIDLLLKISEDAARGQDADIRDLMFRFVQDKDSAVCFKALQALKKMRIKPDEAVTIEPLLKRTGVEIRRGVESLLLMQPDEDALASAQRMLAAANAPQRSAGLEMAAQLAEAKRKPEECRRMAHAFQTGPNKKTEADERLLKNLLDTEREKPTLVNGLGLFDPALLTLAPPPRSRPVESVTPAAIACLHSLDALVEQHREMPFLVKTIDGEMEVLLGNAMHHFPRLPVPNALAPTPSAPPAGDNADALVPPLNELWETWYAKRPDELRDEDSMELLRALAVYTLYQGRYNFQGRTMIPDCVPATEAALYRNVRTFEFKHPNLITNLLTWLLHTHIPANAVEFMMDVIETTCALVPLAEVEQLTDENPFRWHNHSQKALWTGQVHNHITAWIGQTRVFRARYPHLWTDAQHVRFFTLLKWLDQPTMAVEEPETEQETKTAGRTQKTETERGSFVALKHMPRQRPEFYDTLLAYQAGGANETDLLDHLIGVPEGSNHYYSAQRELGELSGRKLPPWCEKYPLLESLVERVRARVLDVELERAETVTAATGAARALRWSGGTRMLVRVLSYLGKDALARSGSGSQDSRINIFSHLVRASYPESTDTVEDFARQMRAAGIGEQRLIELSLFAPQWAGFVEQTLGWPQWAEAVWWIHAHTKDQQWSVPQELRDEWTAQAAERTPLTAQNLLDGAVDVAWFHRVYAALGPERWRALDNAAKYASSAGGHKRAQLYADAMLGRLDRAQTIARVKEKRNQDALRALGLLPLASGDKGEADALERYKLMQEFLRASKQFGAQRQQSEKTAVLTGLENLARTSGYADPARLEWAMEASAVADLAHGAVVEEVGGVTFTLSINPLGKPEFAIARDGKPLKSVPASAKKEPAVVLLQERKREIERQASRMKLSLEQAMCRGDRFTARELPGLMAHPVLAPMMRSVVFVADRPHQETCSAVGVETADTQEQALSRLFGTQPLAMGYPVRFGRALETYQGDEITLDPDMTLRIAHPYDLLNSGAWSEWQQDCFRRERVQPFKQVFRELYVLTENESDQRNISHRYDGQQVNPRQALALLGSRGWVSSYEEGPRRTFHDVNITACVGFFEGYTTPAEVEGLTLNSVYFTRRGEWLPLPLTQVPPRVFSEAMRDIDLVVSVAHQGGVDPEASQSTVEMRASLLRESLRLLRIDNVRLQSSHALVDGKLGTYSVHLGSAIVHRQPGGALCIVPVHGQHRGRLFLPFADDDPKTAEVISKVLLLANDTQIKDPIILEQILVAH